MTTLVFSVGSPALTTATVVRWLKQPGEAIAQGEPLVELEAENEFVVLESPQAGTMGEWSAMPGQTVRAGAILAQLDRASHSIDNSQRQEKAMPEPPASSGGKVTPILMPQAGNTMEEGVVIAWRVKPGDQISIGQILCEIETDKATMDFESPDAGRLARIVAQVGEPVAVKRLIAVLADADADADAFLAQHGPDCTSAPIEHGAPPMVESTPAAIAPSAVSATHTAGRVNASPAARKLARQRGVELSSVKSGSGPQGRILSTDLAAVASGRAAALSTANGAAIRRPLSKMRRAIGLNLQQSKQTVPHFYVRATIDADPLLAFYHEQKTSANCTINDVIVLAVARAMRDFPAVRSRIDGDDIVEYPHANIGIAVGVDEGLVVPVITNADTRDLAELASETKRVVEQARRGRLENVGKGHFTISNLGMFGVEEFSAIINPPESGILAVSAAREAVIVENGAMRAGRSMTLTLSADHRIVDGVMAAQFTQRLQEILERPTSHLTDNDRAV
jgi:pyruvate dehydrogenase E2 component (dihydrolipoyllysine-residue acetyltransferase)